MKSLVSFITAATFAYGIPTFADAASFNCAKASTANEIAICSDDELSTLDETLAAVYKQARGSVSDAKRLKGEQVNWIKSLGTCDGNVDCLISAYRNRILVLDYLDGQVAATLDPLQDQVAQLNEREEILTLREQALTTELRALNSAIEAFEEKKRQVEAEGNGAENSEAQPQRKISTVTAVACINVNMNVYTVFDTTTMIATTSVLIRDRLGEPWRMINEGVYTKANFYFLDSDRTIVEAKYPNNPKGFANREQTNLENGKKVSFEDETLKNEKTCIIASRS
jgi:uncharacterized protein YecT (DUF1311 family)